jgi:hypothetical protein
MRMNSEKMTFIKSLYAIISFSIFTMMISDICSDYSGPELVSCPIVSLTITKLLEFQIGFLAMFVFNIPLIFMITILVAIYYLSIILIYLMILIARIGFVFMVIFAI